MKFLSLISFRLLVEYYVHGFQKIHVDYLSFYELPNEQIRHLKQCFILLNFKVNDRQVFVGAILVISVLVFVGEET